MMMMMMMPGLLTLTSMGGNCGIYSGVTNKHCSGLYKYPLLHLYTGTYILRARPKAERVFAAYENFRNLSDPTDPTRPDRDAFQLLISFEPSYRLENGFRLLKATFNKSFVLA